MIAPTALADLRAHLAAGRLEDAESLARREAEEGGSVAAWRTLATVRLRRGRPEAALDALARAASLDPDSADVAVDAGLVHRAAGRPAEARDAFRRAAALAPGRGDAWGLLAEVALDLDDLPAAAEAVDRGLVLAPVRPAVQLVGARVRLRQRRFAEALDLCRPLLDRQQVDAAALEVAGRAFAALGDDAGAARLLARGAARDAQIRWKRQLAFVLRRIGRVREGASALLGRLDDPRIDVRAAALPQPVWRGEPLAGRTLAVWSQLGVGDEIMMIGQLARLRAAGAEIVLEATTRLHPILARSLPWLRLVAARPFDGAPEPALLDPAIAAKIGIGDLDAWFPADRNAPRPAYLLADRAERARKRAAYRRLGRGPLVGLSWRSAATGIGPVKSSALADWGPILTAGAAVFLDAQYGSTAEERAAATSATGVAIHTDPDVDPLRDLEGHAAQLAAMDLVITTSSTAAHLAGALGVPVWTLLPGPAGLIWYWAGEDDRTPWYASMRLIRPRPEGDGAIDLAAAGPAFAAWLRDRPSGSEDA